MIVNTINIIIIRNLIDGDHFFNFVNNSMNKRLFFKYNIILTNLLLPLDIFKLNLNSTLSLYFKVNVFHSKSFKIVFNTFLFTL